MNIKQKLTSAIVLGSMVAAVVAPASFAATNTVAISGTGAFSYNKIKVVNLSSTSVTQVNGTTAITGVNAGSNTGGNKSSFNVGGTNTVTSGTATTSVGVTVGGSTNTNTGSSCGCGANNSTNTAGISGTGAFSYNKIVVVNGSTNTVEQGNETVAVTQVNASSDTGGNSSSFNVGSGSSITSGTATTGVSVMVGGSSNTNTQTP